MPSLSRLLRSPAVPRLPFPPSPLQVWAVGVDSAQITWGSLPAGVIAVRGRGTRAGVATPPLQIEHEGGPGGLELTGLPSGAEVEIVVEHAGGQETLAARTLDRPSGELLSRVATASDLHIGSDHFGAMKLMFDHPRGRPGFEDLPSIDLRTSSAALAAASTWGADHLVLKGDVVHHSEQSHYDAAGAVVDQFPDLPMTLLPGNHDVDGLGNHPVLPDFIGGRELAFTRGVDVIDMPGVRIVAADVTVERLGTGTLVLVADDTLSAIAEVDVPCLVFVHQQLQPKRVAQHWPPGISGDEANPFLDRLDALVKQTGQSVLISSGHTHRNRVRQHKNVLVTEVGCTHHWGGVWAGYEIYEGGWTQTARRILHPSVLPWMEHTRTAVGGLWGPYAAGSMADRSLSRSF